MGKKLKSIQRANGAKAIDPKKMPVGSKIELSADEKQSLDDLTKNLKRLKIALGDLDIQRARLEQQRAEILNALSKADSAVVERGRAVALSHGIDPAASPAEIGQWQINLDDLVLWRQA